MAFLATGCMSGDILLEVKFLVFDEHDKVLGEAQQDFVELLGGYVADVHIGYYWLGVAEPYAALELVAIALTIYFRSQTISLGSSDVVLDHRTGTKTHH